jgi:cytochrome c-type biogenesis protein CcmF
MSIGTILIYLSLILAIIGIATSFLRLKNKKDKFLLYSRIITILLFVTISLTLVYLYILFFTADLSVEYVWQYTSNTHSIQYKFAGVLAGMAGSLLFWIWAITTPWLYEELRTIKKPVNEDIRDWTRIILFIVISILIFTLILYDVFKPTASNLLLSYPNGQGLNPLLQTELMVIHPPIVFLSYGFLALPFAAALAYLLIGHKDWLSYSLKWSRIGWIFLTLGIGLGALWAYVVLGWGGYWSWDPVETSSLLPWIILTGFLHTQLMFKRKNDYPILAPILGVFSFVLVIFATFVTRAGGLWVSVHTFGSANVQIDSLQRLITLLSESQTVLIYTIFIISSLLITTFLVIYRYKKNKKSRKDKFFAISELISDDILMIITVFLFITTTIVTFVILVSGVNGLDPSDFNIKVGILTLVIILVLIFCLLWRYTGRKWIIAIGGCTLLASALGFIFFPNNSIVAASIPILVIALVGTGYKLIRSFNVREIRKSMRLVSAHLIHLAIILLLLGYIGSNFLVVQKNISLSIRGDGNQVGKYTLYATDFGIVEGINFVDVKVLDGSSIIGNQRLVIILSTSLVDGENKLLRNEIKVLGTFSEDIYLTYQQAYNNTEGEVDRVDLNVKILPLMKLLWGGIWLMILGMVLRIVSEKKLPEEKDPEKKIKGEKYYEDLVEDELKNRN